MFNVFKVSSAGLPNYNGDSLGKLPFFLLAKTRVYPMKDWFYRPQFIEGGIGSLATRMVATDSTGIWDNNIES